jgi:hypothetical protein
MAGGWMDVPVFGYVVHYLVGGCHGREMLRGRIAMSLVGSYSVFILVEF